VIIGLWSDIEIRKNLLGLWYIFSLGTTFVLQFFKILSAPSRASASNIEKLAKEFKKRITMNDLL
jgi:hypothetical protein